MARETLFEELKRYVRFDERDAVLLATFHGYGSLHFASIAQQFYDRIREHESAHAVPQQYMFTSMVLIRMAFVHLAGEHGGDTISASRSRAVGPAPPNRGRSVAAGQQAPIDPRG